MVLGVPILKQFRAGRTAYFFSHIKTCTTIHRYPIFSTRYSVICKVYTGYCGTSEIEHGLCTCTIDNPLAKARGLSPRTGAQTMLYLSLRQNIQMHYAITNTATDVRVTSSSSFSFIQWSKKMGNNPLYIGGLCHCYILDESTVLQIRGSTEDNSKIIFLISH